MGGGGVGGAFARDWGARVGVSGVCTSEQSGMWPDLCLPTGGGGRGVPLGLPQDLRTSGPTQADPPTHPPRPRPYPPPIGRGGGGGLCCYNQLVTQKTCVFAPKNFVLRSLCDL